MEKVVSLYRSKCALVRALKLFICYNQQLGKTEYLNLTEDNFNLYQIEDYNPDNPDRPSKSTVPSSGSRKGNHMFNHWLSAEDFKKSMKIKKLKKKKS